MKNSELSIPYRATVLEAYDYDAEHDISRVLRKVDPSKRMRKGTYALTDGAVQFSSVHAAGVFVLVQYSDGGIDVIPG